MARNCGCAGASCGCKVISGGGVIVFGIGTADDPYVIQAEVPQLEGYINFTDSATVNFTVVGQGTNSDPMEVTAVALPAPFPVYTTAGRPSAATSGAGAFYYDTTLGKPVWSNGTVWKDAAGTTV